MQRVVGNAMDSRLRDMWRVIPAWLLLSAASELSRRVLSRFEHMPRAGVPSGLLFLSVLVSTFLVAAVLAYPALRSRWAGTQLVCAVFVVHFGVNTFITISQGLMFAPDVVTPERAAVWTAHGFIVALVFAFALVLLAGKLRRRDFVAESSRLHLPPGEWLWKLAACAAVSLVLHVVARSALRPVLRESPVAIQMPEQWQGLMLEVGRALLLVAFVLPVIKMMRGGRLETALTVACLLSVLGGVAGLIIPSAFFSRSLRLALLAERGLSNFVYGFLVGYWFSRAPGEL
jgi:hypothetical protein